MTDLESRSLPSLLTFVVDNRGRSCPTASSGFPLIATNCIRDDSLYPVSENLRFVSQEVYDNWFRSHPEPDDIVFVCKGSPGRVAMVPDPVPFCIAQDMVALRVDRNVVHPHYLYYALRNPSVRGQIESMHVGTMIPHFKKGDFGKLNLSIHGDLTEQECVAGVLGALDNKIAANGRLIETILELVSIRLEAALADQELDAKLSDVAEFHNRRRVPLSARERQDRIGHGPYYGATGQFGFVDTAIFDEQLVLVGEDGSVVTAEGLPVVQYIWGPAWINNHAHVLTGRMVSTELLYFMIKRCQVDSLVTGAAQPKLSMGNLGSLVLNLPDPNVRDVVEEFTTTAMGQFRSLADESRTLAELRDFLLPLLMSGRLRVKDAEKQVEAVV